MEKIKLDFSHLIEKLDILPKGPAKGTFASHYESVFKGSGIEFIDFKYYDPNSDDAMRIDWKASLRTGKLLIRECAEERNINVFFLFDVSNSMLFSSIPKLKCEYAAELIGSLSFGILRSNDSVGLGMFSDRLNHYVLPNVGIGQFYIIKKLLSNPKMYGGDYDIIKALKNLFAFTSLKKTSVLFIISDFIGLKGEWESYLKAAAKKFDLVTIMIRDPIDNRLPPTAGEVILKDILSGKTSSFYIKELARRYEEENKKQIANLKRIMLKNNADFIELTTNEDFVRKIKGLFITRKKRFR